MKATSNKKNNEMKQIGTFLGEIFAFNNSLKLYHWHVTGPGSYATHMALDQAIDDLIESLDSIVETSYALYGDIEITIPETPVPSDIVSHASDFYNKVKEDREMFKESFSEGLFDDYQETIQQLLYRLKRLQ